MVSKRELKLKRLAHSSAWLERANKNYTELIYVVGKVNQPLTSIFNTILTIDSLHQVALRSLEVLVLNIFTF